MKVRDKCVISGDMLNVLLLQVIPGTEFNVKEQLTEKGFKGNIYKGFGKYDLIAINESSELSIEKFVPFDNVIGKAILHGFKWLPRDEAGQIRRRLVGNKYLGICCIKLDFEKIKNEKLIEKFDKSLISFEQEIADKIYQSLDQMKLSGAVYGGLGWNELILIIECLAYRELVDAVVRVREMSLKEYGQLFLINTVTIPGVNFEIVERVRKTGNLEELPDLVKAKILLNVKPGFKIAGLLKNKEKHPKPYDIFGEYDIVLERQVSFGELIMEILDLRENFGHKSLIYSTNTILEMGELGAETPELVDKPVELREDIKKICDYMENVSRSSEELRHLFLYTRHLLHVYYATNCNPVTKNLFRNLSPLFNELKDLFYEYSRVKDESIFMQINEILSFLTFAFSQRYSGIQIPYILGSSYINPDYVREYQRVISAIEAIPIFMLEVEKEQCWKGFCIFGYKPEFGRYSSGIINIPREFLYEPQKWFGIFHEIGHESLELSLQTAIKNNTPIFKINLDEQARKAKLSPEKYTEFLWEVFSDMFDYHYGFRRNWEKYFQNIWSYILSLYRVGVLYIARSVSVYLMIGPGAELLEKDTMVAIEKSTEKICKDIKILCEKLGGARSKEMEKVDWDLVKAQVNQLIFLSLDGIRETKSLITDFKTPTLTEKDLKDILGIMKKGKLVEEVCPHDIIRALLVEPEIDIITKISAIISLYNYAMKKSIGLNDR